MFYSDETTNITFQYPALDTFSTWYRSVHGYASLIVCLFGIALNFFNIIVLTRRHMLSSTNAILTALAFSDLITMIVYIPSSLKFYCVLELFTFNGSSSCNEADVSRHGYFWTAYALFYINVTVTMHSISIWLTVLLALFRYLYVCHNKIGKKLCTRQNTIIAISVTYLFCVVLCIPTYIVSKITEFDETAAANLTNGTVSALNSSTAQMIEIEPQKQLYEIVQSEIDLRTNGLIFRITFFSQAFCIKLIPCILLIILSSLLIHSIQVANSNNRRLMSLGRRTRESEKSKEHTRTNIMLVLVCLLFFLTEAPQGVLAIMSIIFEKSNFHSNVYMKLGDVMDIVALINNAINFVLYCLMSHIFRQTFRNIFCKPLCLKYKKFNNSIKFYRTNSSVANGGSFYMRSIYKRNQSDALFNNDENAAIDFDMEKNDDGGDTAVMVSGGQETSKNETLIERNTRFNSLKMSVGETGGAVENGIGGTTGNSNTRKNRFFSLFKFNRSKATNGIKKNGGGSAISRQSTKRTSDGCTPKAVRFSVS